MNDSYVPFNSFLEQVKNTSQFKANYPDKIFIGRAISPNFCTTTFAQLLLTYRLLSDDTKI